MKLLVVLPTKSKQDPLITEGVNYLKRLRPPSTAQVIFLNPRSAINNDEQRKELEGKELLLKTEGYYRIALTESGKLYSSKEFERALDRYQQQSTKIAFLVGGAYGLSHEVIKACNDTLSLSMLTMPHRMAFLILAEQIYRAHEIAFGSPYHK